MSVKLPPPSPPPRPDLETDSSPPSSKLSRAAPPPIPLRPDLGEGVDDDVSNIPVPKVPPATLPKKSGNTKFHGRQEISIISAQPMSSSGAFTPFTPEPLMVNKPSSVPAPAPMQITSTIEISKPTPDPFTPAVIYNSKTANKPAFQPTPGPISGPPTVSKSAPVPSAPVRIPGPPTAHKPAPVPSVPVRIPGPPTAHKPAPVPSVPVRIPGPPTAHKPAPVPSVPVPIPGPPTAHKPAPVPSAPAPIPRLSTAHKLAPAAFAPAPIPGPPQGTKATPILPAPIPSNVLKPPSGNSPSPPKVSKSSKPREPPQRPKSKPVCDLLSLTGDAFQGNAGLQSVELSLTGDAFQGNAGLQSVEKQREPVVPKRKKNKPNKASQRSEFDPMKDFGINNSAFQELEANQSDDLFNLEEEVEMKKEEPSGGTSRKSKPLPTVIRTKANGKDKSDTSSAKQEQLEDSRAVDNKPKNIKPTIIKPQGKTKPPPQSKKAKSYAQLLQDDTTTGIPVEMPSTSPPETQQSKSKPTIIIPKTKKDGGESKETKRNDNITSPSSSRPESNKADIESKISNTEEQKVSKPKRIPSIIRPNREKKDKGAVSVPQNSRGMPEGQSQDSSQSQPKLLPARKAPPRPSPPKPGPPRPGPPKRASNEPVNTQARTPPTGTINNKAKATRPATIGKDKEIEDQKAMEKQKKIAEPTFVSSVVATKIEPSAIALYDYDSSSLDDLSFKAGDEIFLVKKINREWYIGHCNGCEGMMPIKFVEIIEDLPPEEPASSKVTLSAVALYDFQAQSHDELNIHAGDTVQLLEMLNDDWLKGQCNGMTGMFPTNFVDFTQNMKLKLSQQKQDFKPVNNLQESIQNKTSVIISSGPRCKALYDYHTDSSDDLRFDKDDIIKLTERINVEWLKGEMHGTTAMFPAAYVEIIEDLNVSSTSSEKDLSGFPITKALHDYSSDAEGDLAFKQGDMITIVGKLSDDWLEGELHGHRGMLPSAFVENVDVVESSQHSEMPQDLPRGRAVYDFIGESNGELTFKAGDEILLLQHINNEWMEGEFHNHIGHFPTAFIEVLVPLP